MRSQKNLFAVGVSTLVLVAASATAQNLSQGSLRVTEPIEVGGTILPAGDYLIRVLPSTNRSILQITDEGQTKTFATVLTVPHTTPVPDDVRQTEYVYFPATEGTPRVLRSWFPRESAVGGHDIAYPEARATELAAVVKAPVVTYSDDTTADDLELAELRVVQANRSLEPYVAPQPTGPPMVMAQATTPHELPRAASQQPLMAAFGLLMLLAGAVVHLYRTL